MDPLQHSPRNPGWRVACAPGLLQAGLCPTLFRPCDDAGAAEAEHAVRRLHSLLRRVLTAATLRGRGHAGQTSHEVLATLR